MSEDKNQTKAEDTAGLSLGKSSLFGVAGKAALALVGFLGIVFFYRTLGPSLFGIYYTVIAAGKLTTSIQNGITGAIRKRVSEVDSHQSEFLGVGLMSIIVITIFGILTVLSIDAAEPIVLNISEQFGNVGAAKRLIGSQQYLFAVLAVAVSLGLFGLSNQFYAGVGNPGKSIWFDAIRSIITVVTQATLIIIGFEEFGLIWGFVSGSVVTALILLFSIQVLPTFPSKDAVTRTMAFAKWSIPRGFLGQLYGRFDVLLITLVLGSSATGVYAPAMQLTVPAAFLASSIASALNVKSSGLSSMNKSVAADLRNAFSYAGLIPIPILFGAFAFPEQLLEIIFGPSAGAGAEALIILAAFQLFRSYHYPLGVVLDGIDRPDIGFKILIVTLLINIPIALGLVQSFGIFGVALATAIAEGFRTVLSYAVVARVIGYPGIPRVLIKQLFAGSVMFTIIEIFKLIGITPTGSVSLSMVVGLGAVVYFTVLSSVSREFRTTATAILRQTIPERTT